MKLKTYILSAILGASLAAGLSSCDDMLDKGNDYVIYAGDHTLVSPSDTVTSLLGILNRLQAVAVRTNLLGEVRADLVSVRDNASSDLKQLADLDITDDNPYNNPRDYYAIINNCNYYLSRVDSTAGNPNRNEYYFKAEIAQVHSIRAWTYLQLVLAYGRVPLVTEPILTKAQSEASYPMADLQAICNYFINDLQPYYGYQYPDYQSVGLSGFDPQYGFFPTQVVLGDLYLWEAAALQNKESAKRAAKCYYDYIVWDRSGKTPLYTTNSRIYWSPLQLFTGNFSAPSSLLYASNTWGARYSTDITKIAMDSASADGYYNELRNLYNSTYQTRFQEASIEPSSLMRALSEAQSYVGYDVNNSLVSVTRENLDEEALENGYLGDLRYSATINKRTFTQANEEYDFLTNTKHTAQHVIIYRAAQLYLRLAEALNYAGYPRFAKQILTMGLSNSVIENEVLPYYVAQGDTAFIRSFDFNDNLFQPYASGYATVTNALGVVTARLPVLRTSVNDCNMWGVHSRGSGLAFANSAYAPALVVDSTNYPRALEQAVPSQPTAPALVEKPADQPLTYEQWAAIATGTKTEARYNSTYLARYQDSVARYTQYEADLAVYRTDSTAYAGALAAFQTAFKTWYDAAYSDAAFILSEQQQLDQLILDEQALEMAYEGNRFYDLMRRAYWWNDATRLSAPIAKRTANAAKLSSRVNWFLRWNNQIGY